jgi:hypothetical protein
MAAQRYFLSIDDLAKARGQIDALSFHGESPQAFAAALQAALRDPSLFQSWRALQPDPDAVDESLGATDANATVSASKHDLRTDIEATTSLPHSVLRHRLNLLVGKSWSLRDVAAG